MTGRDLRNLVAGLYQAIYSDLPDSQLRVSLNAPLSFDASVKQIVQLLSGHTLCIVPEEFRLDGKALLSFVQSSRLNVFDCTPSHMRILIDAGLLAQPTPSLKVVVVGGEAVDDLMWESMAQADGTTRFYNLYGPTECTVDVTGCRVEADSAGPSIGYPLANRRVYVLDSVRQPVPIGVPGEIYVGGPGLARGYLNRAELTRDRFVADPFGGDPEARMYRTGDRARYRPDGGIEFLGRFDDQVKLRGHRIEPGEISSVLADHPRLGAAAVTVSGDTNGPQRLVAYVVGAEEGEPSATELRAYLHHSLPDYMVPWSFVTLGTLPLTSNGKLDRRSLPIPDMSRPELDVSFEAPRTPVEESLTEIWAEVLKVDRVGIHDNFFGLGGHSLFATRVLSRVISKFGIALPIRSIFEATTVADMALAITQSRARQSEQDDIETLLSELEGLSGDDVTKLAPDAGSGEQVPG